MVMVSVPHVWLALAVMVAYDVAYTVETLLAPDALRYFVVVSVSVDGGEIGPTGLALQEADSVMVVPGPAEMLYAVVRDVI